MFGSETAGPASRNARAGPLPMPAPISPWTIGISVVEQKYISPPATDAAAFERNPFPPTTR